MPILKILYKHNPNLLASEALYWKSISMVVFCIIFLNITTGTFSLYVPKQYRTIIFFRCLTGFIWIQCYFLSLKYMPIGMAITIIFSSPILTTFLAYMFMGETITEWDILSLISSFIGVIILNKPFDSDYKWDNSN